MTLWSYIREHMLRFPAQRVCEKDAYMTFEELVIFSEILAQKLQGESCCAIYCQSEMAAGMALLGCLAAHVTAVPLSHKYGEQHCRRILETISPTCILTDYHGNLEIYRLKNAAYQPPAKHPALIMCTSGTTGVPKGVMLSEQNLRTNLLDIASYLPVDKTDTILIARPLYHAAVLTGEFLLSLIKGVSIRFYSESFQPAALLTLLRDHAITVLGGTPTIFNMLAHFSSHGEPLGLRYIIVSGECLSADIGRRIRDAFPTVSIYHVYGLTEASPRVSYLPPEHFDTAPDCVGIPLPSVQIRIVNAQGEDVAKEETGLLWIRGGNVMMGYYQDSDRTQQVLQNGWLCTGDMACKTQQGWLKLKGRQDDMIIRAGINIYPQEIESVLKQDPRTREALAYGISDSQKGTQIALMITGSFQNTQEVKQLCLQVLPAFQVPTKIDLVDKIPQNASGKITRGVPL